MTDRSLAKRAFGAKSGLTIARLDTQSLVAAVIGAVGFFALASISLSLSKFDSTLASVWLPNAVAVACLLRARLSSEMPFLLGVLIASAAANTLSGTPLPVSIVFSLANTIDIFLVVWITRRGSGARPDMTQLADLARFIWAGGLIGPIVSASIAALAVGHDGSEIWAGASSWFLTDSMGMVLIVPTALLAFDSLRSRARPSASDIAERTALLLGGMACAMLVFTKDEYPLLFLIPPITLLHAFRLGSLGTAIFVLSLAAVSSAMTWAGLGPIHGSTSDMATELQLIQGFLAANFLTGLPVAAILAGRDRIVEELESGRRELSLLTENATDALMYFDLEGRCIYASPSVSIVLGEPPENFLGRRPSDHTHVDAEEHITTAQQRLLSGESDNERFTYRRFLDSAEGTPVFLEAECAIATNPETSMREGVVVSVRDVTERVELELLLTRARRHAENAAHAKSEFLANMSHEIRTPMNGVLGFAELMLQGELDADQRRQVEMIVQSGRSMMLLLNDILDLSKIEAGQVSVHRAPVDIHATLAECAALHRPNAEKKGLELRFERDASDCIGSHDNPETAPDAGTWIKTDGLRVRQIVLNLVGNAVKFTEDGVIHVSYMIDQDQLSVRVTDTGIGISPSRIGSIFSPFTQAESDTARRFGGTGLGLTISRQLAELLGGSINVESKAGVGSLFTLTLPAKAAKPERSALPELDPVALDDLPHHARILLAEDHDVNRMLAREMLERCGQTVAIAHDGTEAISMVIDSVMRGSPYDLVLMDIQMPGCDGYAATRAIRAEGIDPETLPIIALTANAFPEDIAAARDSGMQGHLPKPLVFAALARTLQRWLPTRIVESGPADNGINGDVDGWPRKPSDPVGGKTASAIGVPGGHSPELIDRWLHRRSESIEAVRSATGNGSLMAGTISAKERNCLVRLVHKLAGTAAMFGEEELGEKAAEFEQALRTCGDSTQHHQLAGDLLTLADRQLSDQPATSSA